MAGDYMHGLSIASAASAPAAQSPAPAAAAKTDDGFSFDDLLDIVNPLQHIPVISTIYRHITGDTIKPLEQIAGDTLFGGIQGLASSVADFAFEKLTGHDLGDTVYAFLSGGDDAQPTAVASASPAQIAGPGQATRAPTPLLGAQIASAAPGGSDALMAALDRDGISSDVALRALSAYQSSLLLPKIADASVP